MTAPVRVPSVALVVAGVAAVATVVFGVYAVWPQHGSPTAAPTPPAVASPTGPTAAVATPPGTRQVPSPPRRSAATTPSSIRPPAATLTPPVGAAGIAAAAEVAVGFTGAYLSFRYDEDPRVRAARVLPLLDAHARITPGDGAPAGAALDRLVASRYVTVCTATTTTVVWESAATIELAVDASMHTTSRAGTTQATTGYLVTLVDRGGWHVVDITAAASPAASGPAGAGE